MKNKLDILYVVNHAAFFVSHRLPIALAAQKRGYSVKLVIGQAGSQAMELPALVELDQAGIPYERISFSSAGLNPFRELMGLIQLLRSVKKNQPALMHCISPKGILYGGLVARITKTKGLLLAVSGRGFAFTQGGTLKNLRSFLSKIYSVISKFILAYPGVRIIVQNESDRLNVISEGTLEPKQITLIPGSGVDLEKFINLKIETKLPIVLLPARMVWDKGIGEFIEAARILKTLMPKWRFILAGAADYKNPTSIPLQFLEDLNSQSIVEWVGYVGDMTPYFAQASIVCLPSYREGMPKSLLEGAAAGCATVTTDAVGCRDAIIPEVTGLLVPIRDSVALKNALQMLMENRELRESLGRAGRNLAINQFGLDSVIKRTLSIYGEILGHE
jgi:glycosyltransferase involved in cell wall biosynthesis